MITSNQFGIVRDKRWRSASGQGEISGLPHSRGTAIATDGIIVIIRRADGSLFEGHLDFFVPDKQPPKVKGPQREKKERKQKVDLSAFE